MCRYHEWSHVCQEKLSRHDRVGGTRNHHLFESVVWVVNGPQYLDLVHCTMHKRIQCGMCSDESECLKDVPHASLLTQLSCWHMGIDNGTQYQQIEECHAKSVHIEACFWKKILLTVEQYT